MPKYASTFLDSWLSEKLHPDWAKWLQKLDNDPNSAFCSVCKKQFTIAAMGAGAVSSHSASKQHLKFVKIISCQPNIATLFSKPQASAAAGDETAPPEDEAPAAPNVPRTFRVSQEVTKAEIIWTLKAVASHWSFRSANNINEVFRDMFPDSDIARSFSLGRDKMAYFVVYGLAPCFKRSLVQSLVASMEYTVCFDEAFNKVAQKGQRDLIVRFWSSVLNRVSSRYFTSVFLGRSSAEHLGAAFKGGIEPLVLSKIIQVSMDGPAVNHKFYRELKQELSTGPDDPQLIDLGTCGLHVVNGGFQTGHTAAGWNINGFLRYLYYMFDNSPVRRTQYTEITGSELWPLKVCGIRWTENSRVADRALQMLPYVRKWVKEVNPKPASQVFSKLCVSLADPLLEAKLEFFKSVASQLEPFLTEFQAEKPMVPLLYERLDELLRGIMIRFVKTDVMNATTTAAKLLQIDLAQKSDALQPKPDIGFGANRCLNSSNITPLQKIAFYCESRSFYRRLAEKLVERCPLQYRAVRGASSLSPLVLQSTPHVAKQRFQTLLEVFVKCNRLNATKADKAKEQFAKFVRCNSVTQLSSFDVKNDRLDDFYWKIFQQQDMPELWEVVRKVLVMSHSNASVESGFSVNADLLIENLKQESLVGLRMVSDEIRCAGGPLLVAVSPAMLKSCRSARSRYRQHLEVRRSKDAVEQTDRQTAKRKAKEQLAELQAKKCALRADAKAQESSLLRQMAELQKTLD